MWLLWRFSHKWWPFSWLIVLLKCFPTSWNTITLTSLACRLLWNMAKQNAISRTLLLLTSTYMYRKLVSSGGLLWSAPYEWIRECSPIQRNSTTTSLFVRLYNYIRKDNVLGLSDYAMWHTANGFPVEACGGCSSLSLRYGCRAFRSDIPLALSPWMELGIDYNYKRKSKTKSML